ncbi:paramyosin-like [Lolium rigidum]|uniref:paramyosin-like n=1 Tax=Lolium rigidum TaxID=89674 RepID=UPI001F5DD3D6|nr:paramyosin-like [Lolium rigidum]
MGNTQQAGIKKDDHGHGGSCDQHPQAASVAPDKLGAGVGGDHHGGCSRDQQPQAGAADRARTQLQPLAGEHDVETCNSMLKNCEKNCATNGGGRSSKIDILPPAELSEPDGRQFVLYSLPVAKGCIGDGDGFTAYVKKAAGVAVSGSYKKGDTKNRASQKYRIRMRGIDAPELEMEHGDEARNELVKLIAGKCVTINVYGTDQYGRYLGDIYCDGIFIQEEMLKRGFAWYFKTGETRTELARWEKEAREARQGLWSSDNPQKPWEWKRDHPRNQNNKKVELKSQVKESIETLPWLISKDMETLGKEWKKKLEKIVADNVELNDHLLELERNKKEAKERAKELENEMETIMVDYTKLNDQLEESKKNKKKADDRILKLTFFSESVVAINMGFHDKLKKLKEKNEKAEDRVKESEKEMESVFAVNRELNDQLRELKRNKKVAEDLAAELKFSYDNVGAVNMDLQGELDELRRKNREAEDRKQESEKKVEIVVADNMKLNAQIQRLNNKVSNNTRNSKKKLQSVIAINMDLNDKLQELQKNNEKAKERVEGLEKEMENVVAEERNLQGMTHEESEQAVENPVAPPPLAKGSSEKDGVVWRKKTTATTSSTPQSEGHCE